MSLILWVIRVIVLLFILRIVLRFFAGTLVRSGPSPQRRGPRAGGGQRSGGTLVRDPQCGTYVAQTRALTLGSGAAIHYFCSTACRDAWARAHGF